MNASLLGPCNYYCGNCILYKKNKCFGCAKETERAKTEGKVFCDISLCARGKKLATCSDCESYLCEKYDKGIFAESFIRWIKEKLKEK